MPARRSAARAKAPASVIRITEATGESPRSFDAAIVAAVKASEVKDPVGVEIFRMWGTWGRGRISRYHVTARVAYRQTLRPAAKR